MIGFRAISFSAVGVRVENITGEKAIRPADPQPTIASLPSRSSDLARYERGVCHENRDSDAGFASVRSQCLRVLLVAELLPKIRLANSWPLPRDGAIELCGPAATTHRGDAVRSEAIRCRNRE